MREGKLILAAECRLTDVEGIMANVMYVVGVTPGGGRQGEGKRGYKLLIPEIKENTSLQILWTLIGK